MKDANPPVALTEIQNSLLRGLPVYGLSVRQDGGVTFLVDLSLPQGRVN